MQSDRLEKQSNIDYWWLTILLVSGAAVRFSTLSLQGFWLDEMTSLEVARRSISDIIKGVGFDRHTPPTYYVLLHYWLRIFPESEFGVRSFSALFDLLNIFLIWRFVICLFGRREALLVAGLYATGAFSVYYAQEGRMYTMLLALVLALNILSLKLLTDRRNPYLQGGIVICGVLAAYTHYYGVLALGAITCAVVLSAEGDRKFVGRWILLMLLIGVAFLPWGAVVLSLMQSGGQQFRRSQDLVLPYTLFRFVAGYGVLPVVYGAKASLADYLGSELSKIALLALFFGTLTLLGLGSLKQVAATTRNFVLSGLTIVPLIAVVLSLRVPMLSERYLIIVYPFVLILLVQGVSLLKASAQRTSALLVLVIFWSAAFILQISNPLSGRAEWREAAELIATGSDMSTTLVFVNPAFCSPLMEFYLPPGSRVIPLDAADAGLLKQVAEDGSFSGQIWLVESGDASPLAAIVGNSDRIKRTEKIFPKENGIRVARFDPR